MRAAKANHWYTPELNFYNYSNMLATKNTIDFAKFNILPVGRASTRSSQEREV